MIRFNQNENYHKARSDNYFDYDCVRSFLEGSDHYFDGPGSGKLLRDHIDQINKMTGLGADIIEQWLLERKKKLETLSKS
jgi:hypothetical protein